MENKILFVGMYESGKTTFIACLWNYLTSLRAGRKLMLSTLANTENEYLEKIKDEWLECKKVTRTYMVNKTEKVVMKAKHVASGQEISIEIPDVSGELFSSHFQVREWSKDFEEIVTGVQGIVLFINPTDEKNRTQFIADASAIEDEILDSIVDNKEQSGTEKAEKNSSEKTSDNTAEVDSKTETPQVEFTTWSDEHTSNQVKLVENLQFMDFRNVFKNRVKLSVVISCWDLVEKSGNFKPAEWVEAHMPLLHQYLATNGTLFDCKFFGVSAQGCDYKDTEAIAKIRLIEPFERPRVKEDDKYTNDITSPILWLSTDDTKN